MKTIKYILMHYSVFYHCVFICVVNNLIAAFHATMST